MVGDAHPTKQTTNQQPTTNNQQPTTNKESDRLQIIYQILAISSTILVGANAGVQLFHNLGQNL